MEGASAAQSSPSWAAAEAREEGHRGAAAHQLSAMRQRSESSIVRLAKLPSEQLDEARRQGHATMVDLADAIRQQTPQHSRQERRRLATAPAFRQRTDAAAAAVARPIRMTGSLGRRISVPELYPMDGQRASLEDTKSSKGFGSMSSTGVRSLPGTTGPEKWAALYQPARAGKGLPGPLSGSSVKFLPDQAFTSTNRDFFRMEETSGDALQDKRKHGGGPDVHFADSWTRGWQSHQVWSGRKMGMNAHYSDNVWNKLGKWVDRGGQMIT